jgi:hypothetical protein
MARRSRKPKSLIVTVADDALEHIDQLADRLRGEGMKVDRVMPITGVILGSVTGSKVASLKKVRGVTNVEEEAVAELPPPDSALQ